VVIEDGSWLGGGAEIVGVSCDGVSAGAAGTSAHDGALGVVDVVVGGAVAVVVGAAMVQGICCSSTSPDGGTGVGVLAGCADAVSGPMVTSKAATATTDDSRTIENGRVEGGVRKWGDARFTMDASFSEHDHPRIRASSYLGRKTLDFAIALQRRNKSGVSRCLKSS
jgi:hypothetical protein